MVSLSESDESESDESDSCDIKSERSPSPVLLGSVPVSNEDEHNGPTGDISNGLSDTAQPTQIPRTEPATMQQTASGRESSENNDTSASVDNDITGVDITTETTTIPPREPGVIRSSVTDSESFR